MVAYLHVNGIRIGSLESENGASQKIRNQSKVWEPDKTMLITYSQTPESNLS